MPDTGTSPTVRFSPRRMAHANIFVGDLDKAVAFYTRIGGVEEVRREPAIGAAFLTNGNSHHDFGLMQAGGGQRVGLGGHVQIPKGRGSEPGLNHIGWEMDNEAALVAAYRRAVEAGLKIHRTADHQLSHSVYVFDPDGYLHEFYADVIDDWRKVFNLTREDLITSHWNPEARAPTETRYWRPAETVSTVAGAVFHPTRIASSVIVARNFPRMKSFFVDVAGLTPAPGSSESALLLRGNATSEGFDLGLFASGSGLEPGVHHYTMEMPSEASLTAAEQAARGAGVKIELIVDRPHKRSVFVRDPDGSRLEFRSPRRGALGDLAEEAPALRPYLA